MGSLRIQFVDITADHETDDVVELGILHGAVSDGFAVAQHGVIVAHALALFEKVADVDDADAAGAQVCDDLEEILGVDACEAAGGLIHDEHLGLAEQGPGDLDELLLGDGEGADGGVEGDGVCLQFGQGGEGTLASLGLADPPEPVGGVPEKDVFLNAEIRGEVQLLIDHGDPGAAGLERITRVERDAIEFDGSGVGGMGPAEHLHEGALAGPVLADQGVDVAGLKRQVHAPQCLGGTEGLADVGQSKAGGHHGSAGSGAVGGCLYSFRYFLKGG